MPCRTPVNTSGQVFFDKTIRKLSAADLQHMLSEMWQGFALVSALVLTMTYSTVDVWDVPSTVEFEDTVWGIGVNENTTDARRDALMSTAQSVHDILYCLTFTFSLIIVLVCLSGIEFSAMVPSTKLPAVVYDLGPIWMILPGNLLGVMGVTFTLSVIVKWSCAQTMTIFVINGSAILVFGVGIFLSWVLKLGVVINEVAEKKCSLEDEITTRGSFHRFVTMSTDKVQNKNNVGSGVDDEDAVPGPVQFSQTTTSSIL